MRSRYLRNLSPKWSGTGPDHRNPVWSIFGRAVQREPRPQDAGAGSRRNPCSLHVPTDRRLQLRDSRRNRGRPLQRVRLSTSRRHRVSSANERNLRGGGVHRQPACGLRLSLRSLRSTPIPCSTKSTPTISSPLGSFAITASRLEVSW